MGKKKKEEKGRNTVKSDRNTAEGEGEGEGEEEEGGERSPLSLSVFVLKIENKKLF